jgi:hypothetical protein
MHTNNARIFWANKRQRRCADDEETDIMQMIITSKIHELTHKINNIDDVTEIDNIMKKINYCVYIQMTIIDQKQIQHYGTIQLAISHM